MIKNNITFSEMKSCIDEAVELCFENGVYQPYMEDFAIWHRLVSYFTDMINDTMSVDEVYNIILDPMLRDDLCEKLQVGRIINAYLRAVDMRCQKEIRKTRFDKIIDVLVEELNNPETVETIAKWAEELGVMDNGESDKN